MLEEMKAEMLERVLLAGSDSLEMFGGRFEGGYRIQQEPEDFAEVLCLLKLRGRIRHMLAIGIAAGGAERLICETVGVDELSVIDDGKHPAFPCWKDENLGGILKAGTSVSSFIGDSHSMDALHFVIRRAVFDVVSIDGDHSPDGVRRDYERAEFKLSDSGILLFHDVNIAKDNPMGGAAVLLEKERRREKLLHTKGRCGTAVLGRRL